MGIDIKNMSVEEFIAMKKAMDEAENDNTPYAITDTVNDELQIVGDPNETETQKGTYKMQFIYPNTEEWKKRLTSNGAKIVKETTSAIAVEREYKDVQITPRMYTSVQTAFAELYQFFVAITDDGGIRDLTEEEMIYVLRQLDQEVTDAMYRVVAAALRVPADEVDYMMHIPVMNTIVGIIRDFPDVINGMDFFTDRSSETVSETE